MEAIDVVLVTVIKGSAEKPAFLLNEITLTNFTGTISTSVRNQDAFADKFECLKVKDEAVSEEEYVAKTPPKTGTKGKPIQLEDSFLSSVDSEDTEDDEVEEIISSSEFSLSSSDRSSSIKQDVS